MTGGFAIAAETLTGAIARLFEAAGIAPAAAQVVAEDLVAADLEGLGSHGVMLVPMYLERIREGSIAKGDAASVVSDRQAAIVLDAGDILGQLSARQAVALAASRAKDIGIAVVAVRNAFHFGTAGRYARMLAAEGCIGIVMANTRPLLPPTGGAKAVTGNNPIAIAAPSSGAFPAGVDMALSAAAMGKIRNAAAAGTPIPAGWATDHQGRETTDAETAIAGMLLPAAGPKGFGLAFMIDLLCGGLSGGGIGAQVRPLFGDLAQPYNSANLFIAIDVGHFADPAAFGDRVASAVDAVASTAPAPGIDRVHAPGERVHARRTQAAGQCELPQPTVAALGQAARELGLDLRSLLRLAAESEATLS